MSYYKIRVYSVHGGIDDWRWDPPVYRRYESQIDDIFLNEDGSARPFERDCTYVCQLNAVPTSSNSGSAVFTTFVYED